MCYIKLHRLVVYSSINSVLVDSTSGWSSSIDPLQWAWILSSVLLVISQVIKAAVKLNQVPQLSFFSTGNRPSRILRKLKCGHPQWMETRRFFRFFGKWHKFLWSNGGSCVSPIFSQMLWFLPHVLLLSRSSVRKSKYPTVQKTHFTSSANVLTP